MNKKLILRAASKYRKWLLSQEFQQTEDGMLPIQNKLRDMRGKISQMSEWAERFFSGSTQQFKPNSLGGVSHTRIMNPGVYEQIATTMIPQIGSDIIFSIQHTVAVLKNMVEKKTITILSPREVIEEVEAIVQAWPRVKLKDNVLSVIVKDITLEDDEGEEVYLGNFWIHLNLTNPLDSLIIESIDCITAEGHPYSHPHVAGSTLCIGAGDFPASTALCQGRLEDYFRIVEAVLRTYNSLSPHIPLSEWYDPNHENQFFCEQCEQWGSNDDCYYCEQCENSYCESCVEAGGGCCNSCDEWRCGECCIKCNGCNETLCSGCVRTCPGCSESHCISCMSLCVICEEDLCSECKECCSNCGDLMCKDCTATCCCCGDNNCIPCVDETCQVCEEDVCKDCQATCVECDDIVCKTCDDNKCEHCGIPRCESCANEHNCLLKGATS